MFGSLVFFTFLAAVILVPQVLRAQDRKRMYETLRIAYERGQPVPPEMLEAMTRRARFAPGDALTEADPRMAVDRDLRRAILWLSVAAGLLVVGGCFYAGLYHVGGSVETLTSFAALAAVPGCVGAAFLLLYLFGARRTGRAPPAA